jgi:hypothetical protein
MSFYQQHVVAEGCNLVQWRNDLLSCQISLQDFNLNNLPELAKLTLTFIYSTDLDLHLFCVWSPITKFCVENYFHAHKCGPVLEFIGGPVRGFPYLLIYTLAVADVTSIWWPVKGVTDQYGTGEITSKCLHTSYTNDVHHINLIEMHWYTFYQLRPFTWHLPVWLTKGWNVCQVDETDVNSGINN